MTIFNPIPLSSVSSYYAYPNYFELISQKEQTINVIRKEKFLFQFVSSSIYTMFGYDLHELMRSDTATISIHHALLICFFLRSYIFSNELIQMTYSSDM